MCGTSRGPHCTSSMASRTTLPQPSLAASSAWLNHEAPAPAPLPQYRGRRRANGIEFEACIAVSAHSSKKPPERLPSQAFSGAGRTRAPRRVAAASAHLVWRFAGLALSPMAALALCSSVAFAQESRLDRTLNALDSGFGDWIVRPIYSVLFFDLWFWDNHEGNGVKLPVIVAWLVFGGIVFTLRWRFLNIRAFGHAIAVLRGKFDNPDDPGEVSHFQALSSALSATVGLGNIGGVAVAIGMGGPGAAFWMVIAGFLGMSLKFSECALAQMYRTINSEGRVLGGPMRYLERGFAEFGSERSAWIGRRLAQLFAVLCIGGSFGGGNMFQSNQSYAQAARILPILDSNIGALGFGIGLATIVGVVIIGGIKRIAVVASIIVPAMCVLYVGASLWILGHNAALVPDALATIVSEAFAPRAGLGGVVGVAVMGFRRAAFSNEAGVGSAAIAHSAAATDEPIREGIVALLEPFIDTIVVCSMTALVVVVTGAYLEPGEGVVMTSNAFGSVLPWFPTVLSVAVLLFAISTAISWSYYGERSCVFLFGERSSVAYRWVFIAVIVLGVLLNLENVVAFSDLMILGMSLPNIIALYVLAPKLKIALDTYWKRYVLAGPSQKPAPSDA